MEDDRKSKTKIKNEATALQKIGEQLVELSMDQLNKIGLPEALLSAVKDARQISQNVARRRQMQYIGRLMREIDPEPVQQALDNLRHGDLLKARAFKKTEKWRDELKAGNLEIIEEILDACPQAQRQRLTQLARQACVSDDTSRALKSSRTLFKYLKEIYEG